MIVVVVSSLILHTVNNGKAWSMTVLYAYIQFGIAGSFLKALAPIFTVRTLNLLSVAVVLSPHEPHTLIPRILEEYCNTMVVVATLIIHTNFFYFLSVS